MLKLKNKLIIVLMATLGIVASTSCKKEELVYSVKDGIASVEKQVKITDIQYELDKVLLPDFKQDINLLLTNPEDKLESIYLILI